MQMHRFSNAAVVALAVVALGGACYPDTETAFCANTGRRCPPGFTCSGDGNSCIADSCGNGIMSVNKACEDGNTIDGDGCDSNCTPTGCGNGIKTGEEACDDGNPDNNDDCLIGCVLARCGDGYAQGEEQCDDNNTDTETCPYNETCMICDKDCHSVPGVVPSCGDGIRQREVENCDDGNNLDNNNLECGTCSNGCQRYASAPAKGQLAVLKAKDLVNDDSTPSTFTLFDGINPPVDFTISVDKIISTDGNTVNISDENSVTIARNAISAIINESAASLLIRASVVGNSGAVVILTHEMPTKLGNQPIVYTVKREGFTVDDMAGGEGGDCAAGVRCMSNEDCASGVCVGGVMPGTCL